MFNAVEKHQKLVKGLMIAITATFVVWGIGGYLGMSGDDGYIAKVGSSKIYSQDIDQAMNENPQQQDKMQILFGLINRQLLLNAIEDNHLAVTRTQLQDAIAQIPLFQTNGKFDVNKYETFLKERYITSNKFEKNVQQQILLKTILDFYKNSYFISTAFQDKFAALLSRERNVSQYVIEPKNFYSKISISESAVNAYYQQNVVSFTVPARVKLQYLELSAANLAKTIKVSDAEIEKYLKNHPSIANSEQIDVSHILFSVPTNATAAEKAKIKAKAEQILTQVKANPAKFASLAKLYSQDPGSAAKGGDLGYFGRGIMVKPFENAAFNLKKGQISDLVETQYGFHILRLNDIKNNDANTQKNIVLDQIKKQKAVTELQNLVEQLNGLTYNKPDSLAPAAAKTGLAIQTSDWVIKGETQGLFANSKLQQAIFTKDVLQDKHNSEVVDIGKDTHIVARVTDYQPARQKPISEVHEQIVNQLRTQEAAKMAAQQGQQELVGIQQGKLKLNFTGSSKNVTLFGQNKDIEQSAVSQIFAAPAQKFPAYTGAAKANGAYVIYRINSQTTNDKLIAQNQKIIDMLSSQYAMITLDAYIISLRSRYSVSYRLDRIKGSQVPNTNN